MRSIFITLVLAGVVLAAGFVVHGLLLGPTLTCAGHLDTINKILGDKSGGVFRVDDLGDITTINQAGNHVDCAAVFQLVPNPGANNQTAANLAYAAMGGKAARMTYHVTVSDNQKTEYVVLDMQ
jgi:hypothetical protein